MTARTAALTTMHTLAPACCLALAPARRFALALLLLSALQPFSPSAHSAPPPLAPDTATLAAITPERYPDADIVIVDSLNSVRYAHDGTNLTHDDTLIKILTEKGLRENRTSSFHYNAFYEDLAITLAQVIHPDGATTPIDIAANSKEMIDRAQMSANIYDPNNKIITLSLPGLKVGDTYQIIVERNQKRPIIKDVFADRMHFEADCPILRYTYEVRGPKDKPLRAIALLDKSADTITALPPRDEQNPDGTTDTIHTWIARAVPQYFPEPSMPSPSICTQRILVSTAANWPEISQWYASICEPHLAPTPEIEAKVAELTANAATDDEKIRAIFNFVSRQIRYMGITLEKDTPGFEPHDVALTFNNRYGVCRDKAALLVTMLRCAGYDAAPVLINAGPLVDPQVPYTRFNHAITAIRHPDGTDQLMDSTDETTSELLPAYLANCSYLVARSEGDTLRTSPVPPPERNMLRAATTLDIADDGAVTGTTTLDFTGINDNAIRSSFIQQKPEDIRRWLESAVKQIPGATLTTYEITPENLTTSLDPLRIAIAFTAPDYLTVSRDTTVLTTPWFGSIFSYAALLLGNGTGLAQRRFPLEIPYTCALDETLTINLPARAGETLALPDDLHLALPSATFDKTFTRDTRAITGHRTLRLRGPQVAPGPDYAALKNALKDIEYSNRQSPILAAKPPPSTPAEATATPKPKTVNSLSLQPDIETLNNTQTITLTDAHNWTSVQHIRKKILTYAGKKNNAELRIDYNPVWETVALDHATVTLKDGSTRTVNPGTEINIMDADWVARAPRYPAGKTMVISLPGVEEGSTIEYQITTTSKNKPWFTLDQTYFGFDPIDNYTLTLNAPATLNLTTNTNLADALAPAANPKLKTENPATAPQTLAYIITGSRAAAPREPNLPPSHYLAPIYQATTLPDAASYARLINDAISPLAVPTDAIRKKAAELTAESRTDTDRVTAIRDYVARYIRANGTLFTNLPLSTLTPPERTLSDGYGHNADRAILLAALLRAAGLEPQLLLVGPRRLEIHQATKNIFPIDYFDNLIVRVPADGKLCYVSHTSIYADLQATTFADATALPLPGGTLEKITPPPAYENRNKSTLEIQISPAGDALIRYTDTAYGAGHERMKRAYTEMTPENRQRTYQQWLTSISQAATPAGAGALELDYNYPCTMKLEAAAPRYAVRSGDYLYFQLPAPITSPAPAAADTRIYPLYSPGVTDYTKRWTITLPENTEIQSAPENLAWQGPAGYGTVTVETKTTHDPEGRAVLEITQTIRLDPAVIPAADYPSLLELNRRLSQPAQWRVLLKTK